MKYGSKGNEREKSIQNTFASAVVVAEPKMYKKNIWQ